MKKEIFVGSETLELASGKESRPIEECYWVVPGRFLAGEYPRYEKVLASEKKLRALLNQGVDCFVDLTEPVDRLEPYAEMVHRLSPGTIQTLKFPIRDVSVPYSREQTVEILDAIDEAIQRKGMVYLHCWGGVGRTGVIVGCWLTRHGFQGESALNQLHELWNHCPKSVTRNSPETTKQENYIINWTE